MESLGECTIWIDCDVIQADGGTRTASITGAYVALIDLLDSMEQWEGKPLPVHDFLSAISVGLVDGELMLDLCYVEDSRASVDMNVVMTEGAGLSRSRELLKASLSAGRTWMQCSSWQKRASRSCARISVKRWERLLKE